jgi:hypothetical protein
LASIFREKKKVKDKNTSSSRLSKPPNCSGYLLVFLFDPEDRGGMFLRKFCPSANSTVVYMLRARTVGPEKQPLVANDSETTFISRQRLGKYVPAATDTHATIQVMLETVFSTWSVLSGYKGDIWGNRVRSV